MVAFPMLASAAGLLTAHTSDVNILYSSFASPSPLHSNLLVRRQMSEFIPGVSSASGATCHQAFGTGYEMCQEKTENSPRVCYNPQIGDSCCENTWACPANSYCAVNNYCCPQNMDKNECVSVASAAALIQPATTVSVSTTFTRTHTVVDEAAPTDSVQNQPPLSTLDGTTQKMPEPSISSDPSLLSTGEIEQVTTPTPLPLNTESISPSTFDSTLAPPAPSAEPPSPLPSEEEPPSTLALESASESEPDSTPIVIVPLPNLTVSDVDDGLSPSATADGSLGHDDIDFEMSTSGVAPVAEYTGEATPVVEYTGAAGLGISKRARKALYLYSNIGMVLIGLGAFLGSLPLF